MLENDYPKSLADPAVHARRLAMLSLPNVKPLTGFVEQLRDSKGPNYRVPYLDPADGGINARVLFLLEAPGPKATASGFVSRNNPDETAKNFFLLNAEAGIPRELTAIWNAVPWYIGSDRKIRPAQGRDVAESASSLVRLLTLLPRLEVIVLLGRKAIHARRAIEAVKQYPILTMPHPSPLFEPGAGKSGHPALQAQ